MTARPPLPVTLLPVAALLALGLSSPAAASPGGPIAASGAWSRPVAAGLSMGVAYLTLRNRGHAADRLLGATTPAAARTSLHETQQAGGMVSMAPVTGGLALTPGSTVSLSPGGYHLMLEGVRRPLKAGARYTLTLLFAHATPLKVEVEVRPVAP